MGLDLSKLQNVKPTPNGWQAACPVCRANGSDSTGNHLGILKDGRWSCIIAPNDKLHNKSIWALAGDGSDGGLVISNETDESQIEIEAEWEMSALDRLVKDYSYWETRGISENTVKPFLGGVASNGKMDKRWVFPIINDNNKIIGFTGRSLNPRISPKWKHLGKTSKWVWGGKDDVQSCGRAILVESIADSLSLRESGINESMCLFGVNLSQSLLAYLISVNPQQIIISTNNDLKHDVGQRAAVKIKNILDKFFDPAKIEIRLPQHQHCKDWNEMLMIDPEVIKKTFDNSREF